MTEIELSWAGQIALITLAAPQRRNALTPAMAQELIATCDLIDADDDTTAVVLRGADGHFCAGADRALLARVAHDPTDDERYNELDAIYQAFGRVAQLRSPTVAAVRGVAIGAGLNLALATDLRVVAIDACFRAGFLALGLHPGGGHFTLALRRAGAETAAALAVFGQELSGLRAHQLGMAWEAIRDELVEARALEIAGAVGRDARLARLVVNSLRAEAGVNGLPLSIAIEYERARQLWSLRRARRVTPRPTDAPR